MITHKIEMRTRELDNLRESLQTYGIPRGNIWAVENYTREVHYEDPFKDVDLLKLLLQTLDACDRNIDHIRKKKGIPNPKTPYKPRSKLSNDIDKWLRSVLED